MTPCSWLKYIRNNSGSASSGEIYASFAMHIAEQYLIPRHVLQAGLVADSLDGQTAQEDCRRRFFPLKSQVCLCVMLSYMSVS